MCRWIINDDHDLIIYICSCMYGACICALFWLFYSFLFCPCTYKIRRWSRLSSVSVTTFRASLFVDLAFMTPSSRALHSSTVTALLCSQWPLSHTHMGVWDGCRTVASLSLILMSCVWQCSSSDEKRSFHRGGKQMNWAQLRLCLNQHLNRELSNHWLNRSNEGDTPSATHGEVPVILCVCVVQLQLGSMTGIRVVNNV